MWEGAETEHKLHILTPLLWPSRCVFLVLLDAQTEVFRVHCWMLAFFTASSLDPSSSGLQAPSAWCGFPYHISSLTLWKSAGNCIRGFPSAPSVGCGLPYHIWSLLSGTLLATALAPRTQLSLIIIQRPHDRLLDLWNRMFNRHQAEITVMQFRGYSLPVHDCNGTMGPSPCPIS